MQRAGTQHNTRQCMHTGFTRTGPTGEDLTQKKWHAPLVSHMCAVFHFRLASSQELPTSSCCGPWDTVYHQRLPRQLWPVCCCKRPPWLVEVGPATRCSECLWQCSSRWAGLAPRVLWGVICGLYKVSAVSALVQETSLLKGAEKALASHHSG